MFLPRLNGILAIWKPAGITCGKLCEKIRIKVLRELGMNHIDKSAYIKVGHGGTIDQSATGVLAIGIGNGCQSLWLLLQGTKKYVCKGHLGVETDTYNSDGKVVGEQEYAQITRKNMEGCINEKFLGQQLQTPPIYSAIKHDGRRLSDIAYANDELPEIKPRPVETYSIEVMTFNPPTFTLEISCGRGFYVRSLVHDLGKELGSCAHVSALTRTQHGPFTEDLALREDEWNIEAMVQAIEYTNSCLTLRTHDLQMQRES